METWETICRPPYLGSSRIAKFAAWNAEYDEGNWRLAWKIGKQHVGFLGACALYEDSYWYFLLHHPTALHDLISVARDVYDDAPSNVQSGIDYALQETNRTHVRDIAIRRVVLRLGRQFEGSELIQIRDHEGSHPLSMTLSPGQVGFHMPHLLEEPLYDRNAYDELDAGGKRKVWFREGSVEDFYQRNRVLQRRVG